MASGSKGIYEDPTKQFRWLRSASILEDRHETAGISEEERLNVIFINVFP